MERLISRLADMLLAVLEPKVEAMIDRQIERVETRLRAAVAEIRDDATEVAAPVKAAAAEVREAAESFGDAAALVRRIIGR